MIHRENNLDLSSFRILFSIGNQSQCTMHTICAQGGKHVRNVAEKKNLRSEYNRTKVGGAAGQCVVVRREMVLKKHKGGIWNASVYHKHLHSTSHHRPRQRKALMNWSFASSLARANAACTRRSNSSSERALDPRSSRNWMRNVPPWRFISARNRRSTSPANASRPTVNSLGSFPQSSIHIIHA